MVSWEASSEAAALTTYTAVLSMTRMSPADSQTRGDQSTAPVRAWEGSAREGSAKHRLVPRVSGAPNADAACSAPRRPRCALFFPHEF